MTMEYYAPPKSWRQAGSRWVLSCAGGYTLAPLLLAAVFMGTLLYIDVDSLPFDSPWMDWLDTLSLFYIVQVFAGPLVGSAFQVRLLRNHLQRPLRWLWHTLVGSAIGAVLGSTVGTLLGFALWWVSPLEKNAEFAVFGVVYFIPPLFALFFFLSLAAVQARLARELGKSALRWFWVCGIAYLAAGVAVAAVVLFEVMSSPGLLSRGIFDLLGTGSSNSPLMVLFHLLPVLPHTVVGILVGLATSWLLKPVDDAPSGATTPMMATS